MPIKRNNAPLSLLLAISLIVSVLAPPSSAIQLLEQTLQLKTGSMLGSVGISIAQWDLEFDEDLYYFESPPCAPGLTQPSLTATGVASNPCWAGCDFTSSDPSKCGQPFNTSEPSCQTICDNHPKKSILCNYEDRPWHVIQPGEESSLFSLTVGPTLYIRFNWLQVEQGFRFEALPTVGQISGSAVALMDYSAELDAESFCVGMDSPDCYSNGCPSYQCFRYGTWEFASFVDADEVLDDYTCTSSFMLRTFAKPSETDVRRTEPRADAPLTYPDPYTLATHIPIQFGVTLDVPFEPFNAFAFFQLTTAYCGLINIQHEKAEWDRLTARVAVGVSTDGNPYPVDLFADILFFDGSIKPMWICPRPEEPTVTAYFAVARYTLGGDPPLANAELHYLTIDYYRPEDDWKRFLLGADSSESNFSQYTSFPPLSNWNNGLASNLFSVSCPTAAAANNTSSDGFSFFTCRAGSSTFGTCLDFLFGLPVEPYPISLLPVPTVIRSANPEAFGNIYYPFVPTTASRRLSAFLILQTSLDGSVLTQQLGANWTSLWSQCMLHIGSNSPIASIDGDWLIADLLLEPTVPECRYEEFEQLSEQITTAIEDMSKNSFEAYSQRVFIDEQTFHDPWQACTTFVRSELSSVYAEQVTLLDSVACLGTTTTTFGTDPCCNNDLSWRECCAPRDIVMDAEAMQLDVNATQATCKFASCVEPLLDEYYRAVQTNQLGGCTGPDLSVRLRAPIKTYRDCRLAAFGDDFEMPSCVIDSDCTTLVSGTSTHCNQVTKQCAFNFSDAVGYFFDCLAEQLPIEPRIKLIALNGWSVRSSNELSTLLQQRYGQSTQCVDDAFGLPWSLNNAFLITSGSLGGCPICQYYATDVSSQLPPWCDIRTGSVCSYDWSVYSPTTLGCETPVCNWDQSYHCDTQLLGSFFCGVCEADSVCRQISDAASQQDCELLPSVCFLADGTVRTDLTEQECTTAAFTCTQPCEGGSVCGSRAECEATGYCEPDEQIYLAMMNSTWNVDTVITGFCVMPMAPFNDPECSVLYPGALPSSYGCVVYGDCTGVAELNCTPNYNTPELCTASSTRAVWWPRYGDRQSCIGASGCREELVGMRSLSALGTLLRSPKDAKQCAMCSGDVEPLAEWVSGRWLPGTARAPQWLERALVQRYSLSQSVDFISLYEDIYTSSRAAVAFQLQNNIQCSYQTVNSLLDQVVCACTSSNRSREACFAGDFITNVGLGQACPLSSNTIIASPARLFYDDNGVSSQLQDQCVEFAISRINSRFFYGEAPPPISTGFVPTFTIRGWNAVINSNDALVGQVVGDGIQIHFTQNGRYLDELQVCLQISSFVPLDESMGFTEYSLGYWTGSSDPAEVVPYAGLLNVTVDQGYVCGLVRLPPTGEDISFVPILRLEQWQSRASGRFSRGELALIYIVATFYALLCAAIVVQLGRLVHVGALNFQVATNYLWMLLFFMTVIRAIYMYLVAADVLGQQNAHLLVDFWMMDLPTLLYLICNSIIAISFLFLLLGSRHEKYQNKIYFWSSLSVAVALIVAIFVAILLAFNYAVVDSQGAHGPALCSTYTDNSDAARAIRITYECLLFVIALIIAIVGAVIAVKLWWDLREQEGASSLLTLGSISSFGILSDSLAFLIYYIVNNPTPYFAIVLIFTEILPIAFLVARVSSRQIRNTQMSDSGRQRGGISTSGSGSGTYDRGTRSSKDQSI